MKGLGLGLGAREVVIHLQFKTHLERTYEWGS